MIEEIIGLESVDSQIFNKNSIALESAELASLTHYLHSSENDIAKFYKEDAIAYINEILTPKANKVTTKNIDDFFKPLFSKLNDSVVFKSPKKPKFKFVDLFAGIGGFRLALQNLGGKCIYTSEWNKDAKVTYQTNFGEIPFGDITKKTIKNYIPNNFDVLCAGFPCQAFSIAGHRKGFSDTRGTLFFDVEQIIEKHKPKVVFLENVKNLISHDKGKTFKIIIEILEKKLNYKVFYKVLNSMTHANIPQNRERIFIVAFDPNQVENYNNFNFPDKIPLIKTIHDFIDAKQQEEKYYYKESHKYYPELKKVMTNLDTVYQWRRVYVRENKSNVCPTLTANMGTGGHNVPLIKDSYGFRKLTPKECFAFQGYPMHKYVLPNIANSKLYMQAGNSVTTPLIEKIGKEIVKVL